MIIGRLLQERERTGHGLQCAVRLLLLLLQLNVNDDKYAMLEAAIAFEPQLRDELVSTIPKRRNVNAYRSFFPSLPPPPPFGYKDFNPTDG